MIDEPRFMLRLASRAYASGLAIIPQARESEFLCVPVTVGAMRSTILLPSNWREWDDAKLDAVVAHEVSHVVRRDALTQRLALLHRALFWFSPLAWWLDKRLADLAEQASDEAALLCGIDRGEYAKTLLGFFEALQSAPGRVRWQGVSMAKAGQAEQRVEKILAWKGNVAMSLKTHVVVLFVVLPLPFTYLAASVHLRGNGVGAQKATIVPLNQQPPQPAQRASRPTRASSHRAQTSDDDDLLEYVIVAGDSVNVTTHDSEDGSARAEDLKKRIQGNFIWFLRDDRPYIIRDQATIGRARKLWAEDEEIGRKQEELGKQQEELGKQQEELGARMEKIQVQVPDLTAQLDKLKAELQQMNSSATMEQIGNIQGEIGELQEKIGEAQSKAGEEQSKLGEQMGALGEKQGKLGDEQGRLGERQEAIAREASRRMNHLVDEAIAKGTAQPEQ
jgi:hypothetical protein